MSTPASFTQISKFVIDGLGNPSSERMQHILSNSGLFKELASADFSRIDPAAFTAALTPVPVTAPIPWRPVSEYAAKIAEWNRLRGWGLTGQQIDDFANTLVDHAGPLQPTGISLWLGRDLAYNWAEVMACFEHEVWTPGTKFAQYVNPVYSGLSFLPGSEQSGEPQLSVALLDLATYWDPTNGVSPSKVRAKESRLPGLEVAWLLALNREVYRSIDCRRIPGMIAAGLDTTILGHPDIDTGQTVGFGGGQSDGLYVTGIHLRPPSRWDTVVSFRE